MRLGCAIDLIRTIAVTSEGNSAALIECANRADYDDGLSDCIQLLRDVDVALKASDSDDGQRLPKMGYDPVRVNVDIRFETADRNHPLQSKPLATCR